MYNGRGRREATQRQVEPRVTAVVEGPAGLSGSGSHRLSGVPAAQPAGPNETATQRAHANSEGWTSRKEVPTAMMTR